jgi:uncharacterized membrane protein YkvA (DUF1232 family)
MPRLKTQPKKPGVPRKKEKRKPAPESVLEASDLRRIVLEIASTLAPGDVETLLAGEADIRKRVAELHSTPLSLLEAQVNLALDILRDHADGECPQIPYRTISVLGAGVLYFTDDVGLIPNFLPEVGRLDDAAVMATAFELAHAGIERYCDANDRNMPHAHAEHAPQVKAPR